MIVDHHHVNWFMIQHRGLFWPHANFVQREPQPPQHVIDNVDVFAPAPVHVQAHRVLRPPVVVIPHGVVERNDQVSKPMDMECQVCYDPLEPSSLVQCSSNTPPHGFCKSCIERYMQSSLSGGTATTHCIMGDKICDGKFKLADMIRACSVESIRKNFSEHVEMTELKLLSNTLPDYYVCPLCLKYGCVVEHIDHITSIPCQRCAKSWCPKCHRASHPSIPCERIMSATDVVLMRKLIEEAISSVSYKKCPKCKCQYIKETGCNLMTCGNPGCNAHSCFLCGDLIEFRYNESHYRHFQGPESKCPLWNDNRAKDQGNAAYFQQQIVKRCKALLQVQNDPIVIKKMKKFMQKDFKVDVGSTTSSCSVM